MAVRDRAPLDDLHEACRRKGYSLELALAGQGRMTLRVRAWPGRDGPILRARGCNPQTVNRAAGTLLGQLSRDRKL